MAVSLVVLNGPEFEWGDEIEVQYEGDLEESVEVTGEAEMVGMPIEVSTTVTFFATFEKPEGIEGYDFEQSAQDPSVWIGNVI